jgi:hypothetical protein
VALLARGGGGGAAPSIPWTLSPLPRRLTILCFQPALLPCASLMKEGAPVGVNQRQPLVSSWQP